MKVHRITAFATALLIASAAFNATAQDARTELVQKIAAAEGVTESYDQAITQQLKDYATRYATAMNGGKPNPNAQAAIEKFVTKGTESFPGKDFTAAWVKSYGKDLSLQELQAILNFVESDIGRKAVAAEKAIAPTIFAEMEQEQQARLAPLVKELTADLKKATPVKSDAASQPAPAASAPQS